MCGDESHTKWNTFAKQQYELNKWKVTKATTGNAFTQAIRLAFHPNKNDVEFDAAPISKYAAALTAMCKGNVGYSKDSAGKISLMAAKKDAKAALAKHGIAAIVKKTPTTDDDETSDADARLEAARRILDPDFEGAPTRVAN